MPHDDKQSTPPVRPRDEALALIPTHTHPAEQTINPLFFYYLTIIKRTIPTALSYDVSIGLPVLGIIMTHLGRGDTAPSVTSLLSILTYFQFAGILPASIALGGLFGELEVKETAQQKLMEEKREPGDAKLAELTHEITCLKKKIGRTPKNGMIAGLICTPSIFAMIFADSFLSLLGQDDIVAESAQTFFRAYVPFFLALSPRLGMEFVLLASKNQIAAMLIADAALLATIGLEYALAFETSLELEGLGIASGAGLVLTSVGFSTYVALHFDGFGFLRNIFSWLAEDLEQIWDFMKMGAPIMLSVVSDVAITFAISEMAGLLHASEILNVAIEYLNINSFVTAATSQTTAITLAREQGKANSGGASYGSLRQVAVAGVLANFTLQLPLMLIVSISPTVFSDFVGDSNDESTLHNLMLLTASYALTDNLRYNLLQITRTMGDNAIPSIISSLALWSGVAASYFLSHYTGLGVLGLPLGVSAGALLGTLVLANRLRHIFHSVENSPQKTIKHEQVDVKVEKVPEPIKRVVDDAHVESSSWCNFFRRTPNRQDYRSMTDRPSTRPEKNICLVM